MKLDQAVSPTVPGGMVLTSLVLFTLVYAVLMAADIYLLTKYARAGLSGAEIEIEPPAPEPDLSFVGTPD
jgi:cytochrome d ubiquinol oxidase subunit I